MRVLQILSHLNSGGITSYVYNLSKGLKERNVEVGIASSGGENQKRFEELGIKCFRIPINVKNEFHLNVWRSLFILNEIKRQFAFNLIHAHTRSAQVLSFLYYKLKGIPFVTTCHGYFKRRLSRIILKCWGKYVIAISPQVKEHLIEDLKVDDRIIKVIPTGVDFRSLVPQINNFKEFYNIEGVPFIGSLGRLSKVKRYDLLLKAFKMFLGKYPQAFLGIMGEGKEKEYLLNLARQLQIEKRFRIFESNYKNSFLKSLDLFCLPSQSEGLGLSVIEAMYFGIPCIVSSKGGLKYIIEDRINGIFIKELTPYGIYQSLVSLWEDKDFLNKIKLRAPNYVKEKFSLDNMVEKVLDIYRRAIL